MKILIKRMKREKDIIRGLDQNTSQFKKNEDLDEKMKEEEQLSLRMKTEVSELKSKINELNKKIEALSKKNNELSTALSHQKTKANLCLNNSYR